MQWIHMQTRHLTIAVAITLSAASAHAAETTDATADAALSAQTLDTVSVIGQGETRQVQRITAVDKQVLPPGTSGQKILDRLPGVSVQSNDAFGANEESQTISLRGFDKSRLGYTLDGIPLGDNSYGNYNGLSIARALIAENLAGAELSQGIGSLGVASTSNLGGTIQYFSMDPSTEFGGRASVTVGDNNQRRGYLRVDTGDINGFSAYVSGVHQDQDRWAAPYQNQTPRQFNARPCGTSATIASVRSSPPRVPARPTTPTCPRTCWSAAWAGTGTSMHRTGIAPSPLPTARRVRVIRPSASSVAASTASTMRTTRAARCVMTTCTRSTPTCAWASRVA